MNRRRGDTKQFVPQSGLYFGKRLSMAADLEHSRPTLVPTAIGLGQGACQSARAPRGFITRGLPAAPRPWTLELLPLLGGSAPQF
jgi:hypothetical protein